jgi:hypothetical protein
MHIGIIIRVNLDIRPLVNFGIDVGTTGIAFAGNLSLHWDMNMVSLRGSAK